jgi:hypothetical protein
MAGDLNKISRIKLMILVNSTRCTRSLRNNTLLPMARLCCSSNLSAYWPSQ